MNSSESTKSPVLKVDWFGAKKRFWFKLIALILVECFLFDQAMFAVAQENNLSPPGEYQQEEVVQPAESSTDEQVSQEPFQSYGIGVLPGIGWETPMFQSTDPEVEQDAQSIRDEVLSTDTPPIPSTDINDYINVLDIPGLTNNPTEILYSYTDESDPENDGILNECIMHFEAKPDDTTTWTPDNDTPSPVFGELGKPTKIEFEYYRDNEGGLIYYQTDVGGDYLLDNDGNLIESETENDGKAAVKGIRLWYETDKGEYALFDYSSGSRQSTSYYEYLDENDDIVRRDLVTNLIVYKKTSSGLEKFYTYHYDGDQIDWYEILAEGVTRHFENGEDQNFDGLLGEDLNNNGILDTDYNEDLNNNSQIDFELDEAADGVDYNNDGDMDDIVDEDINGNGLLDEHLNEDYDNDGILDDEDINNNDVLDPWVLTWIRDNTDGEITTTYYQDGLIHYKEMPDGTVWWYDYEYDNDGEVIASRLEQRNDSAVVELDNSGYSIKIEDEYVSIEILGPNQVEIDGTLLELPDGEDSAELDIELLSGTTVTFILDKFGELILDMPSACTCVFANTKKGFIINEEQDNDSGSTYEIMYRLLQDNVYLKYEDDVYKLSMNTDMVELEIQPDGKLKVGNDIIDLGSSITLQDFGGIIGGDDYGLSQSIPGGLIISLSDTGEISMRMLTSEPIVLGYTLDEQIPLDTHYYGTNIIRQDDQGNIIQEVDYSSTPPIVTSYKYIRKIDGTIEQTIVETNGTIRTYDEHDNLVSILNEGVLIEYRPDGLESKITYIDTGVVKEFTYEPDGVDPDDFQRRIEVEHDPAYPTADITRVFDAQKGLLTSITDRNGSIRSFEYYHTGYTEDINGNGLIDSPYSEDLNGNGFLDVDYNEDLNNNGSLDTALDEALDGIDYNGDGDMLDIVNEDVNNNSTLDEHVNEDVLQNGILDTNVVEDRDNDSVLDTDVICGPDRMVEDYKSYTINYYIETRSHIDGDQGDDLVYSQMQITRTLVDGLYSVDPELTDDQLVAQALVSSINWNGSVRNFSYGTMQVDGEERNTSTETRPEYPNFELIKAYNDDYKVIWKKFGDEITKYDIIGSTTIETGEYVSGGIIAGEIVYTYDASGNLETKTDRNGNVYEYTYEFDSLGNLYKSFESSTAYSGQSNGLLVSQFDQDRNVVATIDKNGVEKYFDLVFDEKGFKTGSVETDSRYSDLSIVRTIDNDGRTLTESTRGTGDAERKYVEYEYEIDPMGVMRAMIINEYAAGYVRTTTRRFNRNGDLTAIVDTNGMVTHFTYEKDEKENIVGTVVSHAYKETDFFQGIPAFSFENDNYGFVVSSDDGVNLTNTIYSYDNEGGWGSVPLRKILYSDLTTDTPLQIIDYLNAEVWVYTYDTGDLQQIEVSVLESDGTSGAVKRTIYYNTSNGQIDHIIAGDEYVTNFAYVGNEVVSADVRYQNGSGDLLRSVEFQNDRVWRVTVYDETQQPVRWLEYSYREVDENGDAQLGGPYTVIDSITEFSDNSFNPLNRTRLITHPTTSDSGLPFSSEIQLSQFKQFDEGAEELLQTVQNFDLNNDILTSTDEEGIVTSYDYVKDAMGNNMRIRETSSEYPGAYIDKEYNTNGQMVSQTTRNGFVYQYNNVLDNEGHLAAVEETVPVRPDLITTRSYDINGRITEINSNGNQTFYGYEFDSRGNVIRSYETNGNFPQSVTTRQYDVDKGNIASYTDINGNQTVYEYNELNELEKAEYFKSDDLVNPESITLYYTDEPEKGQIKQIEDPSGEAIRSYTYDFDSLGNLVSSTENDGIYEGYYPGYELVRTYDPDMGSLLTTSDQNGTVFSYNYDSANRLQSVNDNQNNVSVFYTSGQSYGQTLAQSDASGLVASYSYEFDSIGNMLNSYESAAGFASAITTRAYDDSANLDTLTERNGSISSFYYNTDDELESSSDENGNVTYFYVSGANKRRPSLTTSNGEDVSYYSYDFDTSGNLANSYETNAEYPNAITTRKFDIRSNTETLTSPNGTVSSFNYTDNVLTSVNDDLGNISDFYISGQSKGQALSRSDKSGLVSSYTYEYDTSGNLLNSYETQADFPLAITTRAFDISTGNVDTSTDKNGLVSSFNYDGSNQLESIVDNDGNITMMYTDGASKGQVYQRSDASGLISEYSYEMDTIGQLTTSYETDGVFSSAITTRNFDALSGDIQTSTDKNAVVSSFNYDNEGSLASINDTENNITTFYTSGDSNGQVMMRSDEDGLVSSYSYDIDSQTGTLLRSFETDGLFPDATTTRAFNTETGNVDTSTDKNGLITTYDFDGSTLLSVFDTKNNVTTFYTSSSAKGQVEQRSDSSGLVANYSYEIDSLGNIVRSYETDGLLPDIKTTRLFDTASGNILTSTDKNDVVTTFDYDGGDNLVSVYDEQGSVTKFYTAGSAQGQVSETSQNDQIESSFSYEMDTLGNVLRSFETDGNFTGAFTTRQFNVTDGNIDTMTDKNGQVSTFDYDGDVLQSVYDDQDNITNFYTAGDAKGQVSHTSDAGGPVALFSYDIDTLGNVQTSYETNANLPFAFTTRRFNVTDGNIDTMTDKNGKVSTFDYVDSVLQSVIDDDGGVTNFYTSGDEEGQVMNVSNATELLSSYSYELDTLGNIVRSFETDGQFTSAFTTRLFDTQTGNILTSTDKNSSITSFAYDGDVLESVWDDKNSVTIFYKTTDAKGQVESISEDGALTANYSYEMDTLGNVVRSFETDGVTPAAITTRLFGVVSGNIETTTDKNGKVSSFYYDNDTLNSVADDESVVTYFYISGEDKGQVKTTSDSSGLISSYSYDIDSLGNLVASFETDGQIPAAYTTRRFEVESGNLTTSTDKNGKVSSWDYDSNDNLVSVYDEDQNVSNFYTSGDIQGQLASQSDADGLTGTFSYEMDTLGNIQRSFESNGTYPNAVTTRAFDVASGNIDTSTDKNGVVSTFNYQGATLQSIESSEGDVTNFYVSGTEKGNVQSTSDSDGAVANFSYEIDTLGNVLKSYQTNADYPAAITTRTFDVASGNLVTDTNPNGIVSSYSYDSSNNLQQIVNQDGDKSTFYTSGQTEGQIYTVEDNDGVLATYSYELDTLGNIVNSYETDGQFPSAITTRSYNVLAGNIAASTDKNGNITSFYYDGTKLNSVADEDGQVTVFYTSGTWEGQVEDSSRNAQLINSFSYEMDTLGNMTRSFETNASFPDAKTTRTFDVTTGNISTVTDANGRITSYYYDGDTLESIEDSDNNLTLFYTDGSLEGQVKEASKDAVLSSTFSYEIDTLGNIETSYETDGTFTSAVSTRAFDAVSGDLETMTDKNGNVTSYYYDSLGNLSSVLDEEANITTFYTSGTNEGQVEQTSDVEGLISSFSYEYDTLGNMVNSFETNAVQGNSVTTRQFDSVSGSLSTITSGAGRVTSFYYDNDGETLASTLDQKGNSTYFYTSGQWEGQVKETSNAVELQSSFSYEVDTLGNLLTGYETENRFGGLNTTRSYNSVNGNINTSTDAYGTVTSFDYDSLNRLVSLWDDKNSVTKFYVGGQVSGQVSEISKNSELTSLYTYEFDSGEINRSFETDKGIAGRVTTRKFNLADGNIETSTDRSGVVSSFDYDSLDSLVSIFDDKTSVTTFYTSGDAEGQVETLSKADTLRSQFTYDMDKGQVVNSYETQRGIPGRVTTRAFDTESGNVQTSTDQFGSISSFDYTLTDVLQSIYDTKNTVTNFYTDGDYEGQVSDTSKNGTLTAEFEYEMESGDVVNSYETQRGIAGRNTTRAFNTETGNIATSTDRFGKVTSFNYDSIDRLVSVWDEKNTVTNFYTDGDYEGQVSDTSKNDALTAEFSYDMESGDLVNSYETQRGIAGRNTTRAFNTETGNIATSTDRFGKVTSFNYDSIDRLVSVWDEKNTVTNFYTDGDYEGQVSDTSKNDALTAEFSYEMESGDVVNSYETQRGIAGRNTTRAFNTETGNIATSTDRFGKVTSFNYDSIDRLVSVWDEKNTVTNFYTDGDYEGQVSDTSKNDALTAEFSYDMESGDVVNSYETQRGIAGRNTTRAFNTETGNIATSTDRFGKVTSFNYDSIDRLVSVWDEKNTVTNFYTDGDYEGQVSDTSKNGTLTAEFEYEMESGDVVNSYETQRGIEGRNTTRAFNTETGNIATSTDRFGKVTSFNYDSIDRLVSVWDEKNTVTNFYTDGDYEGQVSDTSKNDALTAEFSYEMESGDVVNSYETQRGIAGRNTTRAFNTETGNIATSTDRFGKVTSFNYDSIDRLVSVWDEKNTVTNFYTDGDYEGQVSDTSKNDALTAEFSYEMESGDVVNSYETQRGIAGRNTTRAFNTETGNIATSTDRFGKVTSFNYDSIDRLVSVWDEKNTVTNFYTDGDYEGQVSDTSKNGTLTAEFEYEMESGDVVNSYETQRGIAGRNTTRAFNTETGNIATSTDRFGKVTSFNYDSIDRLVSVWDEKNTVTNFYTDGDYEGQVSDTSKNGTLTAEFEYEMESGDVVNSYETQRGIAGRNTTRAFNTETGNIATSTDRFGKVTSFNYDSIDRLVSVWDEKNTVTNFYTDGDYEGQVSDTSKNGTLTAEFEYDMESGDVVNSYETQRGIEGRNTTRAFNTETGNIATSTDRFGKVTSFNYDSIDRLVSVWDEKNTVTNFYTDGDYEGQVSDTSKNGTLTAEFEYDMESGDVVNSYETQRGIAGRNTTRAFNTETGNIATSTDRFGKVTSFNYDSIDRLVSVWDEKNTVTNFYTDGDYEGQVSDTSKNGTLTAEFEYEMESGDVVNSYETQRGIAGRNTTRAFNTETGNIATSTDRFGKVTSFNYDSIDRLVSVWDEKNTVTNFYTDGDYEGQVSDTSKNGTLTAEFEYEMESGDVVNSYETQRGIAGRNTTRAFNTETGNIATSTDRFGKVTSFNYDSIDRLVSVWDEKNTVTNFYTDGDYEGQVSDTSKNDALTAEFSYDMESGDVVNSYETQRGIAGRNTTRAFNTETGNIATSTDRFGKVTSFNYDSIDRLVSVWDEKNTVTNFYTDGDYEGQVSDTSKNGTLTAEFEYEMESGDVVNSYETQRGIAGRNTTRAFNTETGNIATSTDRFGKVTSFNYDSIDRLVSVWDEKNTVTNFYTDGDYEGQVSDTSKNDALTAEFSYEMESGDVVNSYETQRGIAGRNTTRAFNTETGNIATSTDRFGKVTSFNYDSIDRLVSVWDEKNTVTNFYTDGDYEGQVSDTSKNGTLTAEFEYEMESGDVVNSYETQRGIEGRNTTRAFNTETGNIATSTDRFGKVTSFNYDSIDRLVSVWDEKNTVTNFYTDGDYEGQVSDTSKNGTLTAEFEYEMESGDVVNSYETQRGIAGRNTTRAFNTETGNIATSTDRFGKVTSFNYDSIDRLVSVWDEKNTVTNFYTDGDYEGQVSDTSKNDALTAEFSYEMESGDVVNSYETQRGIAGRNTTRAFNTETGNIATSTDRFGKVTSFNYDSIDRLVSVWDEKNTVTNFYTDGDYEGQVSDTSKNGTLTAEFEYEMESGDVVNSYETQRGIEGRNTTRAFNTETGNIATSTDRFGKVTSFNYDSIDRLVSVWDEKNTVTNFYTDGDYEGQVSDTSKNGTLTAEFEYEMESGDVVNSYETQRGIEGRNTTRAFNTETGNIATSTDRFGKVTSFNYDSIDRLVSVWDEKNTVTNFYTDGDYEGQVSDTSKNDALTAEFSYDMESGDVVNSYETQRGIAGRNTTRAFNTETGNIATSTDRFGKVTSFNYDSIDRLVSVWDEKNTVTNFYTDGDYEGQVSDTSKNGTLTAEFEYEMESGDVVNSYETQRGIAGRNTTRAFNTETGNIATSTDRFGKVTSFNYDSIDRLVSVWDEKNTVTNFYTDGDYEGQVSDTSKNGTLTAEFEYDMESGDVVNSYETQRGIEGRNTTRAFNTETGNIATSTDRFGKVTSFNYDSIDRLVSVWDEKNTVTNFYTDGDYEGQVSDTSKNDALTAEFSYEMESGDVVNSYETQRGIAGRNTTRAFNTETGNIATSTDRFGKVTSFNYDSIDRLVSVWDEKNTVTNFYTDGDYEGQVSDTSKNGTLTAEFEYDMESGDVVNSYETQRGIEGRNTTRAFNTETGNIATSTDRFGKVTSFNYDSIDRLVSVWDEKNTVTNFYTDGDYEGQVSDTSKNGTLTAEFEYEMESGDVVNSYETQRGIAGRNTTRAFNTETGNIATSTDRFGKVTSFNYDSIDRLVSVWDEKNTVTNFYTDGDYEGQVSDTSKNDALTAEFSYDMESGDVVNSYETQRGIAGRNTTRAFNTETGNIATSTDRFGKVTSFNYDSIDRLVSVWDEKNTVTNFYTDGDYEGQVSDTSKNGTLTAEFEYEMESGDVVNSYETQRGIAGRNTTRAFNTETGNIATSTDRFGKVTSFNYDSIDRLVSVWDEKNTVTNFYTDGDYEGQVSDTSKNGTLTAEFEYEMESGDVVNSYETQRGIAGRNTTRAFNTETGNIATSTDRFGKVTSFNYDSIDRLVSVWDEKNTVTNFYTDGDYEGQVSDTSKNDALTAEFSYDMESGDVVNSYETQRGIAGRNTTRAFNTETGNIATSTDRFGKVTSFNYDSIDRLVSVWDEKNTVTNFYTDGDYEGQVSDTSKNDALTAEFSYEMESGDVVNSYETQRGIAGRNTTRAFNTETGNIATSTDRFGKVTSFNYDSIDRLVSVWDEKNTVTNFYTDGDYEGQVSDTSKNGTLTAEFEYDMESGDVVNSYETQRGIEGRNTTRAFNTETGNIATSTDRFGKVTSFNYDSIDRLVSVWDEKNTVTNFYTDGDYEGQVSDTSKNGTLTAEFEYEMESGDVVNSYETQRGIAGRNTTRAFNTETGNIATSTDRFGKVTSFNYDSIDRLVSVWDEKNTVTNFYTDGDYEGQVSDTSKNDALTAEFSYEMESGDVVNSYETQRGIAGRNTTRAFNTETGNIATSTDRFGKVTSFNYDSIDRLVSVWDEKNTVTNFYTDGDYEGQVSDTSKNGTLTAEFEYEMESGDVVNSYETQRGIAGRNTTRAFNTETGNIATSTDRFGKVTSFNYDSIDRLVSVWDEKNTVTNFYTDGDYEGQVSDTSKNGTLTAEFEYEMESGDVVNSYETQRGIAGRNTTRAFNTETGNIATSTDRFGKVTSFNYDSIDRLVSVWDEKNTVTNFYTDGDYEGQVSDTSKNGTLTAEFEYEMESGDVVNSYETQRGIEGRNTTRAFNTETGNIATSTDRFGKVTSFNYDSIDRLVSVWDEKNTVTNFYTDGDYEGQVSDTSKNDALTAEFSYEMESGDVVNSYETQRGIAGRNTTRAFNTETGNIATSTDRFGKVTSFNYDSIDRLVSVWDEKNTVTNFYTDGDYEGQVSDTSKNGTLTAEFEYEMESGDVVNSYETQRGIAGRNTTRAFNTETGNIATSTDRFGKVTSFNYDSIDRLVSVWDEKNTVTNFYTDGDYEGQVSDTSKNDALTAEFSYEMESGDVVNSYETQRGIAGRNTTRAFNTETGNIATSTDRFGKVTSFNYDSIDRLVSVWDEKNTVTNFYTDGDYEGQVSDTSKNGTLTAEFEYEMESGDVVNSYETQRGIAGRNTTRAFIRRLAT